MANLRHFLHRANAFYQTLGGHILVQSSETLIKVMANGTLRILVNKRLFPSKPLGSCFSWPWGVRWGGDLGVSVQGILRRKMAVSSGWSLELATSHWVHFLGDDPANDWERNALLQINLFESKILKQCLYRGLLFLFVTPGLFFQQFRTLLSSSPLIGLVFSFLLKAPISVTS